jgi:fibro-slime domain-containing protein
MPLKNRGFKYQEDRYVPIEKDNACINSKNFAFTMELHTKFTYKPGQYFAFSGDDDVWVYIDNQLALDLGGVHGKMTDTIKADDLGLIEGEMYTFDMFYCERCVGASNILITTNMLVWNPPKSRKRSWKRDYGSLD